MRRLDSFSKARRYVNASELEEMTGIKRQTWGRYR